MHPPFINRSKGNPTFRDGEGFHYGFVGRISKEKGIDLLIRSFQDSADANDRLLIAGKGEIGLGESVIELIHRMASTDNRIELLGFVEEERMNDYFASIDVLVFPSINMLEAFGIVQLEAISAGIPVIASDLPGVRTLITNSGYGLLSKPGDVNDLTRAMIAIKSFEANGVTSPSNSLEQYCSLISNMCG
jgi:glycosyltransferase involved in cell wall biosynthesis